jgi:glycerate kinase
VNDYGIDAFFPILREVVPLETALEKGYAAANLAATTEQVLRCFLLGAH